MGVDLEQSDVVRADRWDDLEGYGEGRNRRGARPALAARDGDPPWVRPLPGAHGETDSYRDVDAPRRLNRDATSGG